MGTPKQKQTRVYIVFWTKSSGLKCLKKNQNAPRPSRHPPVMGEKMSKRLGGIKGCKYKTSSWRLNGFPYVWWYHWVNSKTAIIAVILYSYNNCHAGTPEKQQKQNTLKKNLLLCVTSPHNKDESNTIIATRTEDHDDVESSYQVHDPVIHLEVLYYLVLVIAVQHINNRAMVKNGSSRSFSG